ncbi:hypothetical protein BSK49_09460 [Paenibacillus odorifer]|jgi:hypothetical protein|uniref:DUF1801 domain-containing protein n=1 Tax=Paenibacillus TaxID=44249 RepID=UPI00096BE04B|nr:MULTISPECIES: DUF1801 domain-containing protein [Paenibacillus]MDH6427363.1 hypothetical protein [Paenibacillus sp. PastH-4]MDH6443393.1 hypothetical protein [Paenibacillus sp. PastF-4]MDH6525903.1 hypothetical protein [Paenibacillus sp. PastH-3]OMD66449.1 hypothetical protein BSK62_10670 [Paenibacillus odorifer]OMD79266.1 hypothetical protein BSK50_07490 [Paenibacillus odorifer]
MNQEVIDFIEALKESWQVELSTSLREVVHQAIPDVQERIQYKKPHFLKNGKYAAAISTSKDAVSFVIFNTTELTLPEGVFEGPPERKTLKLRKGDTFDSAQLVSLVAQASASL